MAKSDTAKVKRANINFPANEGEDIPFDNNQQQTAKSKALNEKKEENRFALKNRFLRIAFWIFVVSIIALIACAITSTVLSAHGMNTQPIDELQKTLGQALMLDLGFMFATKIDI